LEAQVDNNDHLLAPLSKKYRLTKEEAGKIPQRLVSCPGNSAYNSGDPIYKKFFVLTPKMC
jgi:hypothetical protein